MTSSSQTISISYDLHPPAEAVNTEGLSPSRTVQVPIKSDEKDIKSYYGALHLAIEEARNAIGEDLTKWRDAAGKFEANKEPKKVKDDEEDGEEDPQES